MSRIDPTKVMFHPITGALLEPLGSRANGRPIWPVMGGSETPPEGGSGGSGGDSGGTGGTGTDSGGAGAGGSGGDGSQSGAGSGEETVPKSELDKIQERMRAADQRAAKAEQELQALKDKDLDEKSRAEKERDEVKQALAAAQEQIQSLRLENAFLRDTTHTWHDPGDVLRFVSDDERVTIDEDGKVQGLEAALKSLAEKKPYLVKKAEGEEPPGPSGAPMGGGSGGGQGKAPERSKLLQTYPQLRGRTKTQPNQR